MASALVVALPIDVHEADGEAGSFAEALAGFRTEGADADSCVPANAVMVSCCVADVRPVTAAVMVGVPAFVSP